MLEKFLLSKYKSPKPLEINKGAFLELSDEEMVIDEATGVEMPTPVSYMEHIIFDEDDIRAGRVQFEFGPSKLTEEVKKKQREYVHIKTKCANVAELLSTQLRSFLVRYYELKRLAEIPDLTRMDFMKMRDLLSGILKQDARFHVIPALLTGQLRKTFTKKFNNFILDRDIYTHGHLHIMINDFSVVIVYMGTKENEKKHCTVDNEIFQAYFNSYKIFSETITAMHTLIEKAAGNRK